MSKKDKHALEQIEMALEIAEYLEVSHLHLLDALASYGYYLEEMEEEATYNPAAEAYIRIIRQLGKPAQWPSI